MLVIITDGNAGVGDDLYSKLSANSNLLTDHQFIFVFVIEMWAYQGQWSLTGLMSRSNDGGKSHKIEMSTEGGEIRERTTTLTVWEELQFSSS